MPDGSLVSTHEDITERERLNERLAEQHTQLDAALDNMLQGLAMFDADHKLIVCNRRYAEMYGLAPEQVKPGTSAREMLEYRIANGLCRIQHTQAFTSARGNPEKSLVEVFDKILDRVAEKDSSSYVAELEDGRYIAVSAKRMPGGGVVTTHQDITEQYRSEAKIAHMALHDALTGLPNRILLNERLEQALGRSRRGEKIAVHVLDLDRFKHVNDTMGHPSGDKLLKMVTGRLCSQARETDTVARLGGDEFAVLQAGISHSDDATALAQRIIEAISSPYEIDGQQVVIGTSVGIAIGPGDGDSPEEILRNADLALYRAKGDGRGTHRFFEQEMDRQIQTRRALEWDLRRALAAAELELHYQPVVDVATSRITGLEALIRWRHPVHGTMAPAAFIPLAEEIGVICQIGEWTIREACATAAHWPNDWKVAVNLSAAQFKSPRLMHVVATALASSGLRPDRLELEITETTLLHDSQATLKTFHELRALGVRIVMDDFGAGHSSLGYLQRFPFDKIKIDRSFVQNITESAGSLNIVRAVAALAHGLGIASTAEGVETPAQLEAVKAEGCSEMQGYLFSRPLPAHEIDRLLSAHKLPAGAAAA
jgi:diguanylate cyclase (GGDEF)-like protein